jgi:hypothetical protein
MDPNLIYAKTASGEDAMRQRTRVVQRNMRMVLILVDGNATVADLSTKTGNVQLVENALRELEQSGFIEPRIEQDSVWEQSKKVAQEIKAAAIGYTSQRDNSDSKGGAPRIEPLMPPASGLARPMMVDSMQSQFSVAPEHSINLTSVGNFSSFSVADMAETAKAPPQQEPVKKPVLLDRLKAYFADRKSKAVDEDSLSKPIRRGGNDRYISWPIKVVFGVLGLLALVFLTAFLFPFNNYLPDVEAVLAQASGQPAKVGEMRVSFYPKPGLMVNNVRIGNAGDSREIRIAEIRLLPVLGTMLSSRKQFREAALSGVTLPAEALAGLSGFFDPAAKHSAKVSVERVILEKTDVSFRGLGFTELNGEIKLTPDGRFQAVSMYSRDRTLRFEATPASKGINIELEAFAWRPSQASRLLVDSAFVRGGLEGNELSFSKLELRVFDGLVQGVALLRAEPQPGVVGEISFERINAKRLGEYLGIGPQFEGETAGKVSFSATANAWPAIFPSINIDGTFSARRGSIGAIDLAEVVRRASTGPMQGGSTRFEQLSGTLGVTPSSYRFSNLLLTSGLMQSSGQLEVSKDLQLAGSIEVQMSGTVNKLRMPVLISGPLAAPLLQVGKR